MLLEKVSRSAVIYLNQNKYILNYKEISNLDNFPHSTKVLMQVTFAKY